jgi:penicillin-binding protein 2
MRLKIVVGFIVFVLVLLLYRVYYLSIISNDHFEQLSKKNYIKRFYKVSSRGSIIDRNGKYLAVNKVGFSINMKPHLRGKNRFKAVEEVAKRIVKYYPHFKYEKLLKKYKRLDSPYRHKMIKLVDYIAYDDFFKYYSIFNSDENIEIKSATIREYLYNDVAAHILGYMGKTTKKDIKKDPLSKYYNQTGRSGLEKYYDKVLRGKLGYEDIQVNSVYKKIKLLNSVEPTRQDIVLTIDIELQKYIHKLFDGKSGAVVVMNVNNGELLAAGSFPEFDNNLFVNGISHKAWKAIQSNFNHPFTNKLINGLYPPGSIIKMGVALSFLENKIPPSYKVYCNGALELGNRKFRCWNDKGHHYTGFTKAIRESCDDFFYKGSLKVGINNIHNTLDRLGIGKKTGIDLPNESKGINPNKAWKKQKRNRPWYVGETVVASIGQGFINVTPMQVARYTGGLATDMLQVPHLLLDPKLVSPTELNFPKKDLHIVQNGMYHVANKPHGTAVNHIRSKVIVAAKTGTAQVVGIPQSEKKRMKEHELEYFKRSQAWLTTYAPYKNPQYVVTILVEHGGHGGSAAGPMVGKIYNKMIELGYIDAK